MFQELIKTDWDAATRPGYYARAGGGATPGAGRGASKAARGLLCRRQETEGRKQRNAGPLSPLRGTPPIAARAVRGLCRLQAADGEDLRDLMAGSGAGAVLGGSRRRENWGLDRAEV